MHFSACRRLHRWSLFLLSCVLWTAAAVGSLRAQFTTVLPTVSLRLIQEQTTEPSLTSKLAPGRFAAVRSGDLSESLLLFFETGGTATPGKDYQPLEWSVTLPAGAKEIEIIVSPLDDTEIEGTETVEIALMAPPIDTIPNYQIDPKANRVLVLIQDNDFASSEYVKITQPTSGTSFEWGKPILIQAVAVDPHGYVARLVFYSDDHQIGVSEINFIVAPEPGTPIVHSFTWLDAPHGKHELRAGIVRADGTVVSSEKVGIIVDPPLGLPEVTVYAAAWKTAEPNPLALIAPGVFIVQRTAPFDRVLRVVIAYAGTARPPRPTIVPCRTWWSLP